MTLVLLIQALMVSSESAQRRDEPGDLKSYRPSASTRNINVLRSLFS